MGQITHIRSLQAEALHRAANLHTVEGYIELLSRFVWDWFAHLTFRDDVHPERADKLFRLWVSRMNRELFGPRWSKKGLGIYWARALEYQKRDVLHFHALLGGYGLSDLRRLTQMDAWNELAGISRIEAPRNAGAVENYVSKYLAKDGEIDLGGPLVTPAPPLYGSTIESPTPREELGGGVNPGCEDRDTATGNASDGLSQVAQDVPGGAHLTGQLKLPGTTLAPVEIEPPQDTLFQQLQWDDGVMRIQSALVPSRMQPRSTRVRAAKSGRS